MRLVRWGLVARLAPVAYAGVLLLPARAGLPGGAGVAAACSPIDPNQPAPPGGWSWLRPSMMSLTERSSVPVATDGFFVIDAEGNDLSAEAAEASMTVEVYDASGALVPGRTWLLKENQPGWYLFGWEASEPLQAQAQLTARLSATPLAGDSANVGGNFPLVVTGNPIPLPQPSLALSTWVDFFRGSGPNVSCKADPNSSTCSVPDTYEVPGSFDKLTGAQALWLLPELASGVAWEAHLEASPSDSDALLPERSMDYVVNATDRQVWLGLATFPTKAERHCVTLVTRDLRTDETASAELCSDTSPASAYETDSDKLSSCLEPPNEATSEAWCRLKGEAAPASCKQALAATSDHESKGCQLALGTPIGSSALLMAATTLLVSRRRRKNR